MNFVQLVRLSKEELARIILEKEDGQTKLVNEAYEKGFQDCAKKKNGKKHE